MPDGLLLLVDYVLMIPHLVVDMDHEALRRVEAFLNVSLQKLPYLVLGFTAPLPRVGDCHAYTLRVARSFWRPEKMMQGHLGEMKARQL